MSNNYQIETDRIIKNLTNTPTLLLHACCAPCSSYVTEYLSEYFKITLYFYNPNITEEPEYIKRKNELHRFISEKEFKNPISVIDGDYSPEIFFDMARGREDLPERGARCYDCYKIRMESAAKTAKENNFDYFCTTLSVSPHKNADWINEIGNTLSKQYDIAFLPSDFKKRNGFKRSIELSGEYNLYRQNYCGCVFSKKAAEK